MIIPIARAALAALLVSGLPAPAHAQTDDRILNDVLALVRGETLIVETAALCLGADMDLSADVAGWTDRNAAVLATAGRVTALRGGLEPGVRESTVEAARAEAARSFATEADSAAFCEQIGGIIDGGTIDFATWMPTEATRVTEAEAGKWPVLDLADARPVADAIAVKQHAFMIDDVLVRCGVLFPPADAYEAARSEWEARNFYTLELADRVLANWGALHPRRWEAARDASGAEVDALVADAAGFEARCAGLPPRIASGDEDINAARRDLYDSVQLNADILP